MGRTIGVTGGSGAGKTTVLRELEKRGAFVIDCDAVYHTLTGTSPELVRKVGETFRNAVRDGKIDRKELSNVFKSPEDTETLSRITHPFVIKRVREILKESGEHGATFIEAVALFESGLDKICDASIYVTAPESLRVKRIMERDGLDEDAALTRIRAQKPDSYYRERCDYVIDTGEGFGADEIENLLRSIGGSGDAPDRDA